jgi:hypothetical protein
MSERSTFGFWPAISNTLVEVLMDDFFSHKFTKVNVNLYQDETKAANEPKNLPVTSVHSVVRKPEMATLKRTCPS